MTGEIRVDGRLDEADWAAADTATDFTQSYPRPGAVPSLRTEALVLYGSDALYVAVRAYDSHPDSIAAPVARRDASGIYSDWIHLLVDSYHDRRTGFRFSVNPRRVQNDAMISNDADEDVSWDAVWQVATSTDSLGWTAEYRIPLSQLRFAPQQGVERIWGFQVQREIARHNERVTWSPWTRQDGGVVSHFGDLVGIKGIGAPHRLELLPYSSTQLTRAPEEPGNPFYRSNETSARVGADVKAGLPGGFTLTGTINPDFGQVEVDPAVVNLTAFETFFPEKRPFFLEGADLFRFGRVRSFYSYQFQQYFYTRRIGRTPSRTIRAEFVDAPAQTAILGAAKLSGKIHGWSVGVLDAVTGEERAHFVDEQGRTLSTPVEPLSNFFVGRVRRDLRGGRTVVGGMLTAKNRVGPDSVFRPLLPSSALLGGVDFEHAWARKTWVLSGAFSVSHLAGSADVIRTAQRSSARHYQRPDATHLELDPTRTELGGHLAQVALSRSGSWDISLDLKQSSPGYEINHMGFQARTDYRSISGFLGRRVDRQGKLFRRFAQYAFGSSAWNFGGDPIHRVVTAGVNGTFNNFWEGGLSVSYNAPVLSDRLTRGGPLGRVPGAWGGSLDIGSDARKPISGQGQVRYRHETEGGYDASGSLAVTLRPNTSLQVSAGPSLTMQRATQQYVLTREDPTATETFGRRYLFARFDQTTLAMETRVDWTFSPTLSLQLYAQPFVSAGDFHGYRTLRRPRTLEYDAAGAPEHDPDFNFRSLRGNAVLRWEYRPGSTLFFAWQQERRGEERFGDFEFQRDVQGVFQEPARNTFLIKASYWLSR